MTGDPDLLDRREIPSAKISEYLLNMDHRLGGPKARFFKRFGFSRDDEGGLSAALLAHPAANPVDRVVPTEFGTKLVVRCNVETPDRRNPCIVTIWIVQDSGPARLVTAYPA